jgi:hypothetical protein
LLAVEFVSNASVVQQNTGHTNSTVYAFIGTILLHDHILRIIAGSIIALVGLGYIALEFIPSIEPPESMRAPDSSLDYENATDTL